MHGSYSHLLVQARAQPGCFRHQLCLVGYCQPGVQDRIDKEKGHIKGQTKVQNMASNGQIARCNGPNEQKWLPIWTEQAERAEPAEPAESTEH